MLADITPVILTFNEAANIGRSLERLTWATEVVVVDSGSTDDTLSITGRFANARVVHRPFDTHAAQWRFAAEQTGIATDWILRLDADYMLEPALREEIAALVPPPETAAYQIGFTYCIAGKPLRASLYPSLPVLIYQVYAYVLPAFSDESFVHHESSALQLDRYIEFRNQAQAIAPPQVSKPFAIVEDLATHLAR